MKFLQLILIFLTFQLLTSGNANTANVNFTIKNLRPHRGVSDLLMDIVLNNFPYCQITLLSDKYFQKHLVRWIAKISLPIYTINLEDEPFSFGSKRLFDHGGTQLNCITIVVCCQSKSTCRTKYSPMIFAILKNYGILRFVRRTFVYIKNETILDLKVPSFDAENQSFSLKLMKDVAEMFGELRSHLTLIRQFVATENPLKSPQPPTFQLLTYTPNWVPGGSPIRHAIWTLGKGFHNLGPDQGIKLNLNDISAKGGTVKVALSSPDMLPMIGLKSDGTAVGLEAELLTFFAEKFNVSISYFDADDDNDDYDADFSGVIGAVLKGTADIGMGEMVFTHGRLQTGLFFSPVFVVLRGTIVCKPPQPLPKWTTLFAPFGHWSWAGVWGTLSFILISLELLQHLMRLLFKPRKGRWGEGWFIRRTPEPKIPWLCWIYTLGPIFQKSIPHQAIPQRGGFRVVLGFWMLLSFLLSIFYGSVLYRRLSFPPTTKPIDSIDDLLEWGHEWALSGIVEQTLMNTAYSKERKLLDERYYLQNGISSNNVRDEREYRYVMKSENNCAITDKLRARFVISNEYTSGSRSLLRLSKGSFLIGPAGWLLRSDLDFITSEHINGVFRGFIDHGFLTRARGHILTSSRVAFGDKAAGEVVLLKALEFESIQTVFYILFFGFALSFLIFIGELTLFALSVVSKNFQK